MRPIPSNPNVHVVIALSAVLLAFTCVPVSAANRFYIESDTLLIDGDDRTIIVACDNDVAFLAFSVAMTFDPSVIEVTGISLGEDVPPDSWAPPPESLDGYVDNVEGTISYGVLIGLDANFDPSKAIQPGTGRRLLEIAVTPLVDEPTRLRVDFVDRSGPPTAKNVISTVEAVSIGIPALGVEEKDLWVIRSDDVLVPQLWLNDVVEAAFVPGGDAWWAVGAPAGTELGVRLDVLDGTVDPADLGFGILGPDGGELAIEPVVSSKGIKLSKLVLPSEGRYFLRISTPEGQEGTYRVKLKGKLPKSPALKFKEEVVLSGPLEIAERTFTGLPGGILDASLKAGPPGADPNFVFLEDPAWGSLLEGSPDSYVPGTKSEKIKKLVLSDLGEYLLGLGETTEGEAAPLILNVKVSPPKKRTIEDPAALPLYPLPSP